MCYNNSTGDNLGANNFIIKKIFLTSHPCKYQHIFDIHLI